MTDKETVKQPNTNEVSSDPKTLAVVGFAGGSNWPIWVGQQKGLFSRHGLTVNLEFTRNSVEMARDMMSGRYQIAMTAIDNVIAYQERQGEIALVEAPDFFAFMGGDTGFLNVMAQADIHDFADLRGKEVSVDAITTGFAFVLREILASKGLDESQVTFVSVGGGAQRLKALLEHQQAATLLNTPLDLIAENSGAKRLAKAEDIIGPYQGVVGMARRSWASEHGDLLVAYLQGYHDAIAWLYDRDNRSEAIAVLVAKMQSMTPQLAEKTYDSLLAETGGLMSDLDIRQDRMRTVLTLRTKYGLPHKTLTDPARYIDLSYRAKALR
jgi:ABC-type nitrate/sulfonate/bicarbonate transport system substrate-binding protein